MPASRRPGAPEWQGGNRFHDPPPVPLPTFRIDEFWGLAHVFRILTDWRQEASVIWRKRRVVHFVESFICESFI